MFGHHHHHHHEEPPATWKDGILLKVVNVAVYFLFLGANIYAFSQPLGGAKETYLTPAAWIYYVWTVVHFLLLGAIVYQFTPAGKKAIVDGISWRLPLLGVLNAIYVNLAARRLYIGAFIMLLFVSGAVTHIYFVIKKYHGPQSLGDELFVHLPFSLYHGWTAVLIMVTTFEAFGVNAATHEAGVWTKLFVFLALLFLDMTVGTYSFGSKEGDLPGAIVICLGLFAIFAHQTNGFIHWSALVFAILSLFGVLKALYGIKIKITGGYIRVEDAERGPLIGHHAVGGHHHGH